MASIAFFLIFIIGFGIRIYFAVISSQAINSDTATIGLMALHTLQGKIPLFFYGQEYMGPIESTLVAFFFLLFGISSLSIYYATLSFSVLFLITTYILTKKICGTTRAGLLAMLYASIPPFNLLSNTVAPLGYHVEILFFGNLIFILTLKIVCDKLTKYKKMLYYIFIGLIGGIGFWNHYTMFYYLIATAVFLAINQKIKETIIYGAAGIIGFFTAGLPFWVYTLTHSFGTFVFPKSNIADIIPAAKRLFTIEFIDLIGVKALTLKSDNLWDLSVFFIIMSAFLYFFFAVVRSRKYFLHKHSLILILIGSVVIFYSVNNYFAFAGSVWYVLPLYCAIMVIIGYFMDVMLKKNKLIGISLLAIVLFFNIQNSLHYIEQDEKQLIEREKDTTALMEFLEDNKIFRISGGGEEAYVPMFLSKGEIIYSGHRGSEYLPYDLEVESSDNVAFVDNGLFVDGISKVYKKSNGFYYDIKPYSYLTKAILPDKWLGYSNYNSQGALYAFDRNCDYWWTSKAGKKTGMYFILDIAAVHTICRIDIVNAWHYNNLPVTCSIEVSIDGRRWELVKHIKTDDTFFWSGPRPYWHLEGGRWEVCFEPRQARYIRFSQHGEDNTNPWEMNEVYLYEYLGDKEYSAKDYTRDAKDLLRFVKGKNIKYVYADFWLSAKIRKWMNDGIGAIRPFNICYPGQSNTSRMVALNRDKCFVINKEDADEFDKICEEFEFPLAKKRFGKFICYYFDNWDDSYLKYTENEKWLYWTGFGVIKKDLNNFSKLLLLYSQECLKNKEYARAQDCLERSIQYYPNNTEAYNILLNIYKNFSLDKLYNKLLKTYDYKFMPSNKMPIEFQNGIKFLGYTINKKRFSPGDTIKIRYYWTLENVTISEPDINVFVYFFNDKKIIFQGDHVFLKKYIRPLQPLAGEVFSDTTFVEVPNNAPSGNYAVVFGLYNMASDKRIPMKISTRINRFDLGEITINSLSKKGDNKVL